ncbi:SGNH/GDSL hydrolase family protein [Comamonas kerstersii]|uniref:SGNH/GDSL hydrolase family protein n=1 Tax=Comamonas kerstersii TaxID=225992 RepID=UPI000A79EB81|nr:SGNH/GDSL hydrolase family protein [Comamonas kerstersii]
MKILLIGGSNTGKMNGYRVPFENNWDVTNKFLGASSSLYGLYALLKMKDKEYDFIVFEYALNDITFHDASCYSVETLEKVIKAVLIESFRVAKDVLFLLGAPRNRFSEVLRKKNEVINTYISVLNQCGVDYIDLTEYLSSIGFLGDSAMYADNAHYTINVHTAIYEKINNYMLSKREKLKERWTGNQHYFDYVDFSSFEAYGDTEIIRVKTSAYSGNALRIKSGGGVKYREDCNFCLMGILANTSDNSGYASLIMGDSVVSKNFFDGFYKENSFRVFLKQMQYKYVANSLEISAQFFNFAKNDKTHHEISPSPFNKVGMDFIGCLIERVK